MYGYTYSKSMDQPGKVANPARGQLNRYINTEVMSDRAIDVVFFVPTVVWVLVPLHTKKNPLLVSARLTYLPI